LLAGLDLLPVGGFIVEKAATVDPRELRSLDAVHLASALSVEEELIALVTYDQRIAEAARADHLVVAAPS
jgi:predicted nucleic acid-binding protein